MFIDRVVNLQNTVFEDYTKESYKQHTLSLIRSYRTTRDELYAMELMNMYETVFIKQARRINNLQDRQDLVLLLVEIFFTFLDEYDHTRSDFAYIISKRLEWATMNFIKSNKPKLTLVTMDEDWVQIEELEPPEEDMSFEYYQLLDCLSPFERRVVESHIIQGMTCTEIAEVEGTKLRPVTDALHRAKTKLRKAYTEMKEDGLF